MCRYHTVHMWLLLKPQMLGRLDWLQRRAFLIKSGFVCLFINIDIFDVLFTLSNVYFVEQREQMLEAQEMFRTANKVTRPEKALILGFMAGSRGEYAVLCHSR